MLQIEQHFKPGFLLATQEQAQKQAQAQAPCI